MKFFRFFIVIYMLYLLVSCGNDKSDLSVGLENDKVNAQQLVDLKNPSSSETVDFSFELLDEIEYDGVITEDEMKVLKLLDFDQTTFINNKIPFGFSTLMDQYGDTLVDGDGNTYSLIFYSYNKYHYIFIRVQTGIYSKTVALKTVARQSSTEYLTSGPIQFNDGDFVWDKVVLIGETFSGESTDNILGIFEFNLIDKIILDIDINKATFFNEGY